MKKYLFLILSIFTFLSVGTASAKETEQTAKEAKELFTKVYDMVFGEKGSSLTYSVNIIGLYKTSGDIIYKGKKVNYKESRYLAWEDGVTAYMVDKKKKKVDIYNFDDDEKDEYLSKFKYDVNNFTYSSKTEGDYYLVTAKVKNSSFFGIREATARVLRKNLHPVALTIKLACFRTTVKISNFHSGDIDDSRFTFPSKQFSNYKHTDHRKQ